MFVMNSTALWLILTVGILNMHNKSPEKHPPRWLESVAVSVLAKLLCMQGAAASNGGRRRNQKDGSNGNLTEEENRRPENARVGWKKMAKIFDRFFLVVFLILDVAAVVIFLAFYPSTGGMHPHDYPKERIEWNLTDF